MASESGESFVVTAALSGIVVEAKEDSLVGHVVKIDHGNGVVTMYQSLKELAVEKGDEVEQGEKLGMAGRNTYNKNAGVHLHFEIRKNGEELNPVAYFGKTAAQLPDTDSTKAAGQEDNKDAEEQEQSTDQEGSTESEGSADTEEEETPTEDSSAENQDNA